MYNERQLLCFLNVRIQKDECDLGLQADGLLGLLGLLALAPLLTPLHVNVNGNGNGNVE